MSILLSTTDFVGEFKVSSDPFNTTILASFIEENEATIIRRIFGATLGNDLIQYLQDGRLPLNADYDKIIDAFQIDSECRLLESRGLKYILLTQIYWLKQVDAKTPTSEVGGNVRPRQELNNTDIFPQSQMVQKYNKGIDSIGAIQQYICENSDLYPDYNGQRFLLNYIL